MTSRFFRLSSIAAVATFALAAGCSPQPTDNNAAPADASLTLAQCAPDKLPLLTKNVLTAATDDPAYDPWFKDGKPSNGQGFESAVTYAIANRLGFAKTDVKWVKAGFNQAIQPGKKKFDFDVNQFSITAARKKAVDFSSPYYSAAQAVITLKGSKYASAGSLAELKGARLGAQIATTSLEAITQIDPSTKPLIYDDTTKAAQSLQNKQVDAIVADLPTAYYLTGAEITGGTIVGQFQPETGESEQFGLLLSKGSKLTPCLDLAIKSLTKDGSLAALQKQWLSEATSVPELK